MSQNLIVAISRQYGSGGRQIGKCLAESLQIPFYDKELIALAAKQSGIAEAFFAQPEQNGYILRGFSVAEPLEAPLNDKVYLAQFSVIRALAQKGPCVMLGCGAGSALMGIAPLINVFVYADLDVRKKRAIEEYGDAPYKIEEHISAIDKKREKYFRFYAGVNGRRMESYHVCIDSGFTGIDTAVKLLECTYSLKRESFSSM